MLNRMLDKRLNSFKPFHERKLIPVVRWPSPVYEIFGWHIYPLRNPMRLHQGMLSENECVHLGFNWRPDSGNPAAVRWGPTEIKHRTACTHTKSKPVQLFYWRSSFCTVQQWPTFHTYRKYYTGAYTQCEICLLSGLINTKGQCAATYSRCILERLYLGSNLYCTWKHTPGLDTGPAVSGKTFLAKQWH